MTHKIKKTLLTLAALAALALGGSALAGAAGGGEQDDTSDVALTGSTLTKAKTAALKATGGGEVNQSERDGEKGATYEVEVTKPDGSTVDVRLDEQFKTVAIDGDSEDSGDDKETNDGPDQGPDQDPNEPGHQD